MSVSPHSHRMIKAVASLLFVLTVIFMQSCGKREMPVYSQFVNVNPDGWEAGEYLIYNLSDGDSTFLRSNSNRYDVIMTVRHTTDYPYNNLWLVIDRTSGPELISSSKTELRLAEHGGSWRGKGIQGIYEFSDTVFRGIPLSSDEVISVRHDMPVSSLPGVLDLGMTVINSTKKQ